MNEEIARRDYLLEQCIWHIWESNRREDFLEVVRNLEFTDEELQRYGVDLEEFEDDNYFDEDIEELPEEEEDPYAEQWVQEAYKHNSLN